MSQEWEEFICKNGKVALGRMNLREVLTGFFHNEPKLVDSEQLAKLGILGWESRHVFDVEDPATGLGRQVQVFEKNGLVTGLITIAERSIGEAEVKYYPVKGNRNGQQ